jgi:predicted histidine transporter YuiF (NhaC family)
LGVIKKTVAIHPVIDKFIRKTWAVLIENGYDATYSTALNYMLLIAIMEVIKRESLNEETINTVCNFLKDEKTIEELNLTDQLSNIAEKILKRNYRENKRNI